MIERRRFVAGAFLAAVSQAKMGISAQDGPNVMKKKLPVEGKVFEVAGHEAFLIEPTEAAQKTDKPWVWYAPTLKPYPGPEERWMIERFLKAGISVAGIDVGESYGSPAGVELFGKLFDDLTTKRGYATKPALLARSRGGLMHYSWASRRPSNVSCIAGIYPVCDFTSWPSAEKAAPAYGLTPAELIARAAEFNPVDRLAPLAKTGVPIFHIHGDSDTVVPLERNSGAVAKIYEKLGGKMTLVVPKGQGHNMWKGFFECQELVDFVIRHCDAKS
jgi:hypothetical protein